MSKFKIYKASAGSGKTYSLVYEYLKILISNPNEYKHILAVTFTNDATEEMKSRVLNQLKLLADKPAESPYILRLIKELNTEDFIIGKRAAEALGNILHDYSNFNISTIDTFFQKILRAFAKDIGLSAAYNLQLDYETAVQEITENVIANTTNENKQAKWLMKAALEKIEEGKSWNIREELKNLFTETFKESYQVKEEKIKASFQDENRIEELQAKIQREMLVFETHLEELALNCNAILNQHGLHKNIFPYKELSFYNWIGRLTDKIIQEPSSRLLNALDNLDCWYAKSADKATQESIISIYHAGLNDAIKKTYEYYLENIHSYNSNQLIKQNLSYFVMFEYMVEEMMKYKAENDVLFISDTNQFISQVIGNNEESFIFEKAGNYFHHYLIDEFQDTSQLQWGNFRPLISNAVSQGNTSLVVGDVKQSIYRFRNGDWRLLQEQAGREITYNEVIPLKENHRSLENIILFNNSLYKIAPSLVSNIYKSDAGEPTKWTEMFAKCYTDQEQSVPEKNKNSGGFIKLKTFCKTEEEDWEEQNSIETQQMEELVKDIESALKRGYNPADIAILVFTKKEAYKISSHLRKYVEENSLQNEINIVTQSSLNISNSHTVRLIIAALKFLANKKDEISLAQIFSEYQQYFSGKTMPDFLENGYNEKIEGFKTSAMVIKSMPLQVLMEHIIRFFSLDIETNEHIFLQHFKDALFEYLKKNVDDLSNFIEWWEESHYKFQVEVPQNEKSLEIITIHKSKGLEFDLVFIPFAEWSLDSNGLKADMLWLDLEEEGVKTLPVKYDKKMQNSSFNEDYLQTKFYNYLDKLNLLYVATTRAVRELYIYTDTPKSFSIKAPQPNIRTIFNHILALDFPLEGNHYLQLSDYKKEEKKEIIIGEKTFPTKKEATKTFEVIEAIISSNNIFDTLGIKQKSSDLRDEIDVRREEWKQTGILFHEVVANTRSELEAKEWLNKWLLQRTITKKTFKEFSENIQKLFSQPLMVDLINNYKVYSEQSFFYNNTVIKPDKFFINDTEAIVVDFKTGKPMPEYADQVLGYCNAVKVLFGKPTKGYLYYTQTHQFEAITA